MSISQKGLREHPISSSLTEAFFPRASIVQSAGNGGGWERLLASTVSVGALRLLTELRALSVSRDGRIRRLRVICHPLTDYVHQSLKCLLHVNVVLGTGLKELKACDSQKK